MWGPKVVPSIVRIVILNPFQTEDIYSVRQAIADESGLLVTHGTYVLEGFLSTDNGANWSAVINGIPRIAVAAIAVNGTNIFAGTLNGVFLSTNSGSSWTEVSSGLTNPAVNSLALNIDGIGGTNLFAGTNSDVFLSTNAGADWTVASAGLGKAGVNAFSIIDSNLLAGTPDGVFLSTNNGKTWSGVYTTFLPGSGVYCFVNSPNGSGSSNLFAGAQNGTLRSTNNGMSWTLSDSGLINIPVTSLAVSLSGLCGTNLFAGSIDGGYDGVGISRSTDNGISWTAVDSGLTNPWIYSLAAYTNGGGPSIVFAGVQNGGVFVSTDEGANWTLPSNTLANTITTALAVMPNDRDGVNLLAGTQGSGVFLSTDNGASWTQIGLPNTVVSSFVVSGKSIFTSSNQGVFLSTNDGANWNPVNSGLNNTDIRWLTVGGVYLYAGTGADLWRRPLSEMISSVNPVASGLTHQFLLEQNYPNPFNPTTTIGYSLSSRSHVTMNIFNPLGQKVATLVDETEESGHHSVRFDGSSPASGVYFYRIVAGTFVATKKLLVLR